MFLPAAQFGGGTRYDQQRLQICADTNFFSDLVWCSRVLFTADVNIHRRRLSNIRILYSILLIVDFSPTFYYILLVTQAPILVWFDGTIIDNISTILLQCTTTV